MNAVKRGILVVFEGIDECGKTTQSLKLIETLNKRGSITNHQRFPDRTTKVGKIRPLQYVIEY
jgi:dTMP kinase